jgi:hypothetical protein
MMAQNCICSEKYNRWYRVTLQMAAKNRDIKLENERLKLELLGYQKRLHLITRIINEMTKAIIGN